MPTPKHKPSKKIRDNVAMMAAFGIPAEHIAGIVGISRATLYRYYKDQVQLGGSQATALVGQSLFVNATKNMIPACQIFWMKTRAGWKEKTQVEHSGEVGTYDLSKLSLDELKQLRSTLAKASPDAGNAGRVDSGEGG